MKPFHSLRSLMAVACVFFLLPACRKVAEVLRKDPHAVGQFCRIDTFYFGTPVQPYQQTIVKYNSAGDPEAILPLFSVLGEEFDEIYFRYDRFDRLRDVIFVFPGGTNTAAIDLWHRFAYPRPGIVIDSSLNYDGPGVALGPSFVLPPNPPPFITAVVSGYEQDRQGRTVRTWTEFPSLSGPPQPLDTTTISYDRRGNQIRPGVTYDDKFNIYRTNRVWQLLFQDYSANNPVIFSTEFHISDINSYNRWGLPKLYEDQEGDSGQGIFFYLLTLLPDIQVAYSCDGHSDWESDSSSKSGGE
ncbi:MAG TPA: hypothetical protein VG101_21455 [Puia sp.]|jgi:hypothetical protein|nr:hypothetical protein [Puia sp.]